LLQIPFGMLLDRYGPRRVDAGLLVIAAVGALVYAMAPSFAGLVAGRVLIGAGVSMALMASFQAFVLWYPIGRIATINSRAFAVGILGAITVSVPLEAALRVADWRTIMLWFALLALGASATIFFVVPEREGEGSRASLGAALGSVRALIADAALRRVAVMASTTQGAVVALSTLWVATWLRDVAGYDRAAVGQALLVVNLALIAGFLVFGRLADARARRGVSPLPVVAAGIGLAALCLGLLAAGVVTGALALWAAYTFFGTAATLGYSIVSRRFPKELAGRVVTTLNTFIFTGMFLSQWAVGLVLERWPRSAGGYSPEAYAWALGMLCAAQFTGLVWLWRGRKLFEAGGGQPGG
jgi:predicted MFS family arabinose efflux permease